MIDGAVDPLEIGHLGASAALLRDSQDSSRPPIPALILKNETTVIGLFQGMFDKNILTFNPGWDQACATLPDFDDLRDIQRTLIRGLPGASDRLRAQSLIAAYECSNGDYAVFTCDWIQRSAHAARHESLPRSELSLAGFPR
jgi:hypothetical protein